MQTEIIISVIIPHYNTPSLLKRCLSTIPDKSEIQVIIVDDNSSSTVVDFNNFPGDERQNTEIIYNKNSRGAGFARNLALPHARGKWIIFADADDYFTSNAWTVIFNQIDKSDADIIYLGIQSVDSDTNEVLHDRGDNYSSNLRNYIRTQNKEYECLLRFWNNAPWGKIIRHQLIIENNIIFGETKHCNDVLFSTKTAIRAQKIAACPDICYCVTHRRGSLTQDSSLDAISMRYEVILQKNQLLRNSGYPKFQQPIHSYLRSMLPFGFAGIRAFSRLTHKYNGSILNSIMWFFRLRLQ